MKVRTGFVSNSSSSSFVCQTDMSMLLIERTMHKLIDLYEDAVGVCSEEKLFEVIEGSKAYDEMLKDWDYLDCYGVDGTTVGKIIIESASDNSIPYELFDLIKTIFKAERLHLG